MAAAAAAYPSGSAARPPPTAAGVSTAKAEMKERVDYHNLPCPNTPYTDIQREASATLKANHFEGFQFAFFKGLNNNFAIGHMLALGPRELPLQPELKSSVGQYDFLAVYEDPKVMLQGRWSQEQDLHGVVRSRISDRLTLHAEGSFTSQEDMPGLQAKLEYQGKDYRTQLQLGNPGKYVGANYLQSVTPNLSLGGELVWVDDQNKSAISYAARYATDKEVAAGSIGSNGMVSLSYFRKLSEKLSVATDFNYNYLTGAVVASAGYFRRFRQGSTVKGSIDSNGAVSAFAECPLLQPFNLKASGQLDHKRTDYKFGIGIGTE